MSRLYYDPKFRAIAGADDEPAPPKQMQFSDYLEKVSRLVPAEVLAAYLTMSGLAETITAKSTHDVIVWVIFASGLIFTPIYLNSVADAGKPKIIHIIISSIAFVVWAYVTTGKIISGTIDITYQPAVASIVLIIFSLASAKVSLTE